jgi:asparagine synthase (glutamine-hydrolysing)
MCGVTGLWLFNGASSEYLHDCATRMADRLVHRGPDDAGVWVDADAGLALGFRRLSILDLSAAGHQPMLSIDGRYTLVFNGEIYNHRDIRRALDQAGTRFRGSSDTEVLVEAVAAWGVGTALRRVAGMFAIAVWDRRQRELVIARDRIGKKPLYYAVSAKGILFASELKALVACPEFTPRVDRSALAAFMRFGYVPGPQSIYEHVHKLSPGTCMRLRPDYPPEIDTYWRAEAVAAEGFTNRRSLSDVAAVDELEALLGDAVRQRMVADVPLGALLSGGVDSSAIVALMQANSDRQVKTFTIGFPEQAYDEADSARAVAQRLGTEHIELYVDSAQALGVIPKLPFVYDEPFADASQIPTMLVYELARRHVVVALSGDGGDELFAGYTRYRWATKAWKALSVLPLLMQPAAARAIRGVGVTTWDGFYRRLEPAVPRGWRQTLPGGKLHKVAALLGAPDPDRLYQRLVSVCDSPEDLVIDGMEPGSPILDPSFRQAVPDFTERMMLLDQITYLPDDILVKVDRASMAVGLEARSPLLDHRVVEWAWSLPLNLKQRQGESKWVLRRMLERHVPKHLTDRPKMGFGVPLDQWLRGPLRDWAETLLDERRLRSETFFNPAPVRTMWREHLAGEGSHQKSLWAVLTFQAWRSAWNAV